MRDVTLVVFHRPPRADDPPLTALLAAARQALLEHQVALFRDVGAGRVVLAAARGVDASRSLPPLLAAPGGSFGEALAGLVRDARIEACVVLGSGAVPRLRPEDARRLVEVAGGAGHAALTNNRYSSDVCAVADAATLRALPPLPSDNALPRWLEEVAGYAVADLPGRDRLALDLDGPLDLALLALAGDAPAAPSRVAAQYGLSVPRLDEIRAVGSDPRRELLVFGRSSSRTLAWLERHVRCRVRFLAEERGMRASSPLAMGGPTGGAAREAAHGSTRPPGPTPGPVRPVRATIGRLLAARGPDALPSIVAELADAAILDSRVLLADRLGPDEDAWPADEDRFASDLLRPAGIADPWLRDLTAAAAGSPVPILLGGHTLVGPGVPLLLRAIR